MDDKVGTKIEARSLVDAVAERLEEAIIAGKMIPGERIREFSLAQSLGVSRGPLREAIRRLEGRRLLERKPNFGVRVVKLSEDRLDSLLHVREALEGMGCRQAAIRMSDEDLKSLQGLLDAHATDVEFKKVDGYYQAAGDFDFHFRIAKASENELLIGLVCGDLYDLLRVYRYKSSKLEGRAKEALAEHRAIVGALLQRDPDVAEAAMRLHLKNAREYAMLSMRTAMAAEAKVAKTG